MKEDIQEMKGQGFLYPENHANYLPNIEDDWSIGQRPVIKNAREVGFDNFDVLKNEVAIIKNKLIEI